MDFGHSISGTRLPVRCNFGTPHPSRQLTVSRCHIDENRDGLEGLSSTDAIRSKLSKGNEETGNVKDWRRIGTEK
jgi:hypothetical protein